MKNKGIFILNKKEGKTPLEALESFRRKNKIHKDVKMTYAGRLDPLVSGLLVILAGNIRKEKDKYLGLSKEYYFTILFGFSTDTYDILGKVVRQNLTASLNKKELERKIKQNLRHFTGKFKQKYPLYSSKTIAGKPLFSYGRLGLPVERPEREAYVKSFKFFKLRKISSKKFLENIERRVSKVNGDFRQKEIIKIWQRFLRKKPKQKFFIASLHIKCSSGTYVRAVANDLGERIGVPSLALTIKRTKIGKWGKISA